MHGRSRVIATWLAVVSLLGAIVPALALGASGCAGVAVTGAWRKIGAPLRAVAFTVDASGRIYVAGDREVAISSDGGCSWSQAVHVEDVPPALPPAPDERVTALAATEGGVVAALTGPSVLVTRDGGDRWTRSAQGLDLPGTPLGLYEAADDVVYMLVRQGASDSALSAAGLDQGVAATTAVVYRSSDGGRTWTRGDDLGAFYSGPEGSGIAGGSAPGAPWDIAVDPGDPDHLLAAAADGVFESADGGRTWTASLVAPGAHLRTVAYRHAGAAVAVDPSSGTVYEKGGSGGWRSRAYPQLRTELMEAYPNAAAWAWAAGYRGGAVVSGPKGVFTVEEASLTDVTPRGFAGPGEAVADLRASGSSLWGRLLDGSALVTHSPTPPGSHDDREGRDGSRLSFGSGGYTGTIDSPRVARGAARLVADVRRVELAPGETAIVGLDALIDPRPVSVDVYFLVDTTSSMSDTIRSLVEGMGGIVRRLARSGVRLRAGIGAFRTYPRESDRVVEDYAYRRIRALGPVDAELLRSLYDLEGRGSSGANLTAVLQAVTGSGQDVLPPGPSKADVAAGQEAGFDEASLNVIVHMADTWFGTPERGDPNGYYAPGAWPGPSPETAAAALRAEGVLHLGVALQPGGGGTVFADADVVEDMRELSRATASVAGERGADCDGDGRSDLRPGDPLVCLLERGADATGLVAVVAGLVEALEHRGPVALAESGASGLVRRIAPAAYPDVDLRGAQRLPFEVTVGCGLTDAGTDRTVRLDLLIEGLPAGRSSLAVSCTGLAARIPSLPRPSRRSASLPLVPPVPAPPPPHTVPGPGSVTAPAPVQAPAPAQAPGGQPQPTAVAQRQQQPQPAFAAAVREVRAQTQMQHALVRTRPRAPLEAARLWTAVGALSILWGWGLASAAVASIRRQRA